MRVSCAAAAERVSPSPPPVSSRRSQSDVMIVAGTLTNKMAPALRKVYDQMPDPCVALLTPAFSAPPPFFFYLARFSSHFFFFFF